MSTFIFLPNGDIKTVEIQTTERKIIDFSKKTLNVHGLIMGYEIVYFCKENSLQTLHSPHLTFIVFAVDVKFINIFQDLLKNVELKFGGDLETKGKILFFGKTRNGKSKFGLLFNETSDEKSQITEMRTKIHQAIGIFFAKKFGVPFVYKRVRHQGHIHIGLVNQKTNQVIFSTRMMHFGVCKWLPHLTLVDDDFKLKSNTMRIEFPIIKFSFHEHGNLVIPGYICEKKCPNHEICKNGDCQMFKKGICWFCHYCHR